MLITSDIPMTPALIAAAFWELDSVEQAEFFAAMHDIVKNSGSSAYSLGEMQWLYMGDEIAKNPKAKAMACALMAPIFLHATNLLERQNNT